MYYYRLKDSVTGIVGDKKLPKVVKTMKVIIDVVPDDTGVYHGHVCIGKYTRHEIPIVVEVANITYESTRNMAEGFINRNYELKREED